MNTLQKRPLSIIMSGLIAELEALNIKKECCVSLKRYSTFSIGGTGDVAVFPQSRNELASAVGLAKKYNIPYEVIGRGSNVLFPDDGYRGMIIFTSCMRQIHISDDGIIYADAGENITSLSMKAANAGLSGLEFACGIPGSCGGAVYMNAGAYGGEISDVLAYSEYYDTTEKTFKHLSASEHDFSYRHSIYADTPGMIITGAAFKLERENVSLIKERMNEYNKKRQSSQPHEYPNAGSIFKRPTNGYAAKMIDDCGLKGLTVGGAQVSEKHAGFIVNKGGATAENVLELISEIKDRVRASFGVELECEIKIIK